MQTIEEVSPVILALDTHIPMKNDEVMADRKKKLPKILP